MAELEIPDRALQVACAAYDAALNTEAQSDDPDCWEHAEQAAVRAAAPIIVAAELRSFVAALREMIPVAQGSTVDPQLVIDTIAGDLKRRADELDPEGGL